MLKLTKEIVFVNQGKTKKTLFPNNKRDLIILIYEEIHKNGVCCSLNHIDVSKLNDLSGVFMNSNFDGDISEWDVSNVQHMNSMFSHSCFTGENGSISDWDVSNVKDMTGMFVNSKFNGDISSWDVSNVEYMSDMFASSYFTGENGSLEKWNVENVKDLSYMFYNCNNLSFIPFDWKPKKIFDEVFDVSFDREATLIQGRRRVEKMFYSPKIFRFTGKEPWYSSTLAVVNQYPKWYECLCGLL